MLTLLAGRTPRLCDRLPRRDFLRVGAWGTGSALTGPLLAPWLATRSARAATRLAPYDRGVSVVLLFLGGGPSQYETFDPKPDGPGTSTSCAGHLATRLPGVRFASYLPQLADRADRLSIVRSFRTNHAEHNGAHKQILTADLTVQDGKPIRQPGLGAVCARVTGPVDPTSGLPTHVLIPPTTRHLSVRAGFTGSHESVVEGCQPAWLGPPYAPLEFYVPMAERDPDSDPAAGPNGPGRKKKSKGGDEGDAPNPILDDLEPRLPTAVFDARLDLLRQFDRLERGLDARGAMDGFDAFGRQAVELIRGGAVRRALDLSQEDPATLAAYDTERFRNWRCGDDSLFDRSGPSIGASLGRQLLMARRLCESGARFVTLIHSNWDFHARKGIPNVPEGMGVLAPPLDHAVSAFLDDVAARGLSERILLVITGEFGRTPGLDQNLGRHHWPGICPLVFAGGGLRHGQTIGESDRRGGEPATEPYLIDDLHATVLHALFDVGKMRLDPKLPREVQVRAEKGRRIEELFS